MTTLSGRFDAATKQSMVCTRQGQRERGCMRGGPDDERVSIFEGALNGREERQQKENGAQNIFFLLSLGWA